MLAARFVQGQLVHDRVEASTSAPSDLRSALTNIVHIKRCSPVHPRRYQAEAAALGLGFKRRVTACTRDPAPGARALVAPLGDAEVREHLLHEVTELVQLLGQEYGLPQCNVKLEVLGHAVCPRWHADHVGVRLLVSLLGPGTMFVENRHAKRRFLWAQGATAVADVDERYARAAAAGDLVILKGHAWPGNYGCGAVHRSPDVEPGSLRLLLTMDDVVAPGTCCGDVVGGVVGADHMADPACAA